ncbi:MAG: phosphoribosylformylglycinamidine synthase subunit PurQ [Bdellovibrionota bacterium]|nr:phosphoribosylformylglycinamidine synthase subunit PurQ [Bdellovibrionota bacterium]
MNPLITSKKKPHFLVLAGDGINCEQETKLGFEKAKAKTTIIHINELLDRPKLLRDYQGLAFPGGFSFGDELGSGQVLALKCKRGLKDELNLFVEKESPIIGICNGFQTLLKLGLLPFPGEKREVGLAPNREGTFQNYWVKLKAPPSKSVCHWTEGIFDGDESCEFELPLRNREGRITLKKGSEDKIYNKLLKNGQIPLQYSDQLRPLAKFQHESIAGLCDPKGLIFGLMPHPEASLFEATHRIHYKKRCKDPDQKAWGQKIFDNIVGHLKRS